MNPFHGVEHGHARSQPADLGEVFRNRAVGDGIQVDDIRCLPVLKSVTDKVAPNGTQTPVTNSSTNQTSQDCYLHFILLNFKSAVAQTRHRIGSGK